MGSEETTETNGCLTSYERTCCSRSAAHIAQAIVMLKFVGGEAAEALAGQLRPFVSQVERLKG